MHIKYLEAEISKSEFLLKEMNSDINKNFFFQFNLIILLIKL